MEFLKENIGWIVLAVVVLVVLWYFFNRRATEKYQDDIVWEGRSMEGRGRNVKDFITRCTPHENDYLK